jgi:hypothetical protein
MADIPASLIKAIQNGNVIPFIGGGVSMAVEDAQTRKPLFPSWRKALRDAAKILADDGNLDAADQIRACLTKTPADYLEAAQVAHDNLNWEEFLVDIFDLDFERAKSSSLNLARSVWNLGSNFLITTNFDRVLQWSCPQPREYSPYVRPTAELARILRIPNPQKPIVWHLHGRIDNSESIVFTKTQFQKFYDEKEFEAGLKTLEHLLLRKSFLFIGFSLSDEYFNKQLEYINRVFKNTSATHYVLLESGEAVGITFGKNIKIVPFQDHGPPLLELIEKLGKFAPPHGAILETEAKYQHEEKLSKPIFYKVVLPLLSIGILTFAFFAYWNADRSGQNVNSVGNGSGNPVSQNANYFSISNQVENSLTRGAAAVPTPMISGKTEYTRNGQKEIIVKDEDNRKTQDSKTIGSRPSISSLVSRAVSLRQTDPKKALNLCYLILREDPKNRAALILKQEILNETTNFEGELK